MKCPITTFDCLDGYCDKHGCRIERTQSSLKPRTTLTDGTQVYPGHDEHKANGQQRDYVVLAEEERAKGFMRPVRVAYTHLKCGATTTMSMSLAETYARDPSFYSGTFCSFCHAHYPVGANGEFVWLGTKEKVGT